jgi:hypothetical protein
MSVALEFIDFIVPIRTIREKYPGGWEQCLKDHSALIGGRVWYDDHLLRNGAMNPQDIEFLFKEWEGLGFQPNAEMDGRQVWRDFCIMESFFGGPTLPCPWIEFSGETRSAWLKGTLPGKIISREDFPSP